jgi:hypothetical protein
MGSADAVAHPEALVGSSMKYTPQIPRGNFIGRIPQRQDGLYKVPLDIIPGGRRNHQK